MRQLRIAFKRKRQPLAKGFRLAHRLVHIYQHWDHHCGFCGGVHLVGVTAKHILVCSYCGRW